MGQSALSRNITADTSLKQLNDASEVFSGKVRC